MAKKKSHAVFLPFPAQGHINPMFKLAAVLHHKGFHITFVNTEYNHRRLLRAGGDGALNGLPTDFQFETIPDGLPPASYDDRTQDVPSLSISTKHNCLAPFRNLLAKLKYSKSPPVSCVISDAIMTFSVAAGREIGVPVVCFRTTNARSYLCNKHVPVLIQRGLLPLKDATCLTNGYLDTAVDFIPSLKNTRLRDFPSFVRTTDINDPMLNFVLGETEGSSKASAIIFNTFEALESDALAALTPLCPPIYALGPVHSLANRFTDDKLKSIGVSLWKEEKSGCIHWLDSKQPNSVLYVNFGSITVLTRQQMLEFAWGLANSGTSFLWTIRSDAVVGDATATSALPSEFISETKDRALITGWCPQEQVLSHPSIAGFLTHSGWNSMVESMSRGVPMICWPFFAEQQLNCGSACLEWGVGVEISKDVKRGEVEKIVRGLIEGEEGRKMKKNAAEWKAKVEEAVGINGSSWLDLDRLIKDVLLSKFD
ncbi:7-deoxyloganetin glucosyltransferase-like [Henckelia pumila]|uniref:7-deoxyloganetin glucosyltransferase-like n=1 Tax=Henckelia pumila TaxID=405737 RepID=UPI003C6DCBCE